MRANRMMWLMNSDLVGLRTSADAGPSLNDCYDLFIHQADCDKAASAARLRRKDFPHPFCCSKALASLQEVERRPAELRAVGLLLEIWTLSKLWANLMYRREANRFSDRPGTRTWHSRPRGHVHTVCNSCFTLIYEVPPSPQRVHENDTCVSQGCSSSK